jgi:hypothetical protein
MKQTWLFLLVVLAVSLSACGLNPVDKLEEAAGEQIAEKIVEQATGAENVEFDVNGDSASYSVTDEEGNTISVDAGKSAAPGAFTGMGFTIPLPDGLVNGTMQEIGENGKTVMVQGIYEMDGLDLEQFYAAIHQSLTNNGFTYVDIMGGDSTTPDPTDPNFISMVNYTHEDGYQFSILGDTNNIILNLTAVEQ